MAIRTLAVPNLATSTPEISETTILAPEVLSLDLLLLSSAVGKIRLDGGAPDSLIIFVRSSVSSSFFFLFSSLLVTRANTVHIIAYVELLQVIKPTHQAFSQKNTLSAYI